MKRKKLFLYYVILLMTITVHIPKTICDDNVNGEWLFNYSMEELMNLTVKTGNLTGLSLSKTPISVTTITSEDIAVTPVRNIYDLIEVYVPGAIYLNHYDSPHLGVRGIIVDRNYKYLLLVNGRNMNLKAHNGATSELELWDLDDIEKIEIIRGPGSVTYGPGAVAGIINITTKNSSSETGIKIKSNYCYPYKSEGISAGISHEINNNYLFVYGSIQKTNGYSNPKVYAPQGYNRFNYMGFDSTIDLKPIDYFYDYNGLPQLKFNVDYSFSDTWNLTLRYTRQGAALNPNFGKPRPQVGSDSLGGILLGDPFNLIQNQDQHITLTMKNESSFENLFDLSSMINLSSEDYIRRTEWFQIFPKSIVKSMDTMLMFQDINGLWTHNYDFSESSILGHFIFNKNFSNKFKMAIGTEMSLNHWGPGWGKDRRNLRLGDNGDIISGTDSYVYGSKISVTGVPEGEGYFVGDGWSTFSYSFLFELMWEPVTDLSFLLSARSDKDSYSQLLFSPRASLIYQIEENNILKLVIQKSQRMNTAGQLLIQHMTGKQTDPETLTGLELIYSGLVSENLMINSSFFYNKLEVISWYNIGRTTRPTGDLSLFGLELEGKFQLDKLEIALNQSYVKQLNWKLADSVYFSGISYSDYQLELNNMFFNSSGNDLSNWSNFVTKFIINYKLFDENLILHLDSRIFWNFEGENEGMKSFENAMDPANQDYKLMQEILNTVRVTDMYGTDFRVNISIGYIIFDHFKITASAMNLLGYGGNKRYFYDSGIRKDVNYIRHGFIEEPLTLALKLDIIY